VYSSPIPTKQEASDEGQAWGDSSFEDDHDIRPRLHHPSDHHDDSSSEHDIKVHHVVHHVMSPVVKVVNVVNQQQAQPGVALDAYRQREPSRKPSHQWQHHDDAVRYHGREHDGHDEPKQDNGGHEDYGYNEQTHELDQEQEWEHVGHERANERDYSQHGRQQQWDYGHQDRQQQRDYRGRDRQQQRGYGRHELQHNRGYDSPMQQYPWELQHGYEPAGSYSEGLGSKLMPGETVGLYM
jgi:hypothetical protein